MGGMKERGRGTGTEDGFTGAGYVFNNPDTGQEYSPSHPIDSGECDDAQDVRRSTEQEDLLWREVQARFAEIGDLTARLTSAETEMRRLGGGAPPSTLEVARDLHAALLAHEAWEAGIVLDADWGKHGMAPLPRLTQELLDALPAVQERHNAAVARFKGIEGQPVPPDGTEPLVLDPRRIDDVKAAFTAGRRLNAAKPGGDGDGDKARPDASMEADWREYAATASLGEGGDVPVALTLNVFDDEAAVSGSRETTLTRDAIADIVDHAVQAVAMRRAGGRATAVLDELDEALTAAGAIGMA